MHYFYKSKIIYIKKTRKTPLVNLYFSFRTSEFNMIRPRLKKQNWGREWGNLINITVIDSYLKASVLSQTHCHFY